MCDNLCRTCGKTDGTLLNVFDNELDKDIGNKIAMCFGFLIKKEDKITKNVCRQCVFLINSYSELRQTAISTNLRLLNEYAEEIKEKVEAKKLKDIKEEVIKQQNNVSKTSVVQVPNQPSTPPAPTSTPPVPISTPLFLAPTPPVSEKSVSINQTKFLNKLNLTSTKKKRKKAKKVAKKRLRYHTSVSRIKMSIPGLHIPTKCNMWNIDPIVVLNRNDVQEWINKLNSTWTVNSTNTNRPGIYLKKIPSQPSSPVITSNEVQVNGISTPNPEEKTSDHNAMDVDKINDALEIESSSSARSESTYQPSLESDFSDQEDDDASYKNKHTLNESSYALKDCEAAVPEDLLREIQSLEPCYPVPPRRSKYRPNYTEIDDPPEDEDDNKKVSNNASYTTATAVNEHGIEDNLLVPTNHTEEAFICNTCNKIFDTKKSLSDHNKEHRQKSELRCPTCSKKFTTAEALIKHNLEKHIKNASVEQQITEPSVTNCDNVNINNSKLDSNVSVTSDNSSAPNQIFNKSMTKLIKSALTATVKNSTETSFTAAPINLEESDDDIQIIENNETCIILSDGENEETSKTFENLPKIPRSTATSSIESRSVNGSGSTTSMKRKSVITSRKDTDQTPPKQSKKDQQRKLPTIPDEEFYIKLFFQKNLSTNQQQIPAKAKLAYCPIKRNKVWVLKHVDKLLEKSFIPIEYVPSNDEGLNINYVYNGAKKTKPISTAYTWDLKNAIDIPNSNKKNSRFPVKLKSHNSAKDKVITSKRKNSTSAKQNDSASFKQSVSASPNQSVSASPNQSVSAAPNQSVSATPKQSVSAALNQSVSAAPNQSVSAAPKQSVSAALNQSVSAAPNQSVSAAPKQSVSAAPKQSVSAAPKQSVSASSTETSTSDAVQVESIESVPVSDSNLPVTSTTQPIALVPNSSNFELTISKELNTVLQRSAAGPSFQPTLTQPQQYIVLPTETLKSVFQNNAGQAQPNPTMLISTATPNTFTSTKPTKTTVAIVSVPKGTLSTVPQSSVHTTLLPLSSVLPQNTTLYQLPHNHLIPVSQNSINHEITTLVPLKNNPAVPTTRCIVRPISVTHALRNARKSMLSETTAPVSRISSTTQTENNALMEDPSKRVQPVYQNSTGQLTQNSSLVKASSNQLSAMYSVTQHGQNTIAKTSSNQIYQNASLATSSSIVTSTHQKSHGSQLTPNMSQNSSVQLQNTFVEASQNHLTHISQNSPMEQQAQVTSLVSSPSNQLINNSPSLFSLLQNGPSSSTQNSGISTNTNLLPVTQNNDVTSQSSLLTDSNKYITLNGLLTQNPLTYSQYDQQTNVRINNYVSINLPNIPDPPPYPNIYSDPVIDLDDDTQSMDNTVPPVEDRAVIETVVQKPMIRIKDLSELTERSVNTRNNNGQNMDNLNNLHNPYLALSNFMQTMNPSNVRSSDGNDEYIRI